MLMCAKETRSGLETKRMSTPLNFELPCTKRGPWFGGKAACLKSGVVGSPLL